MKAENAKIALRKYADASRIDILQRFFKTGKGEYAEGDIFIGVYVPDIRKVSKEYTSLSFSEIEKILKSKVHEDRVLALFILVNKFKSRDIVLREKIFDFYIKNTKYINNWDLVDLSAREIVGGLAVIDKSKEIIIDKFSKSDNLWEKRISMISTFAYINKGDYKLPHKIAKVLLVDNHDLIQKAVGWSLREIGKKIGRDIERDFILKSLDKIKRITLYYSLEHFDKEERSEILALYNRMTVKK